MTSNVGPEPQRNLILVHSHGWQAVEDFQRIKSHVEAIAPDIAVFVASNDIPSSVTRKKAALRPTLIFSPVKLLQFRPARGKVYAGAPMSKLDEMRLLAQAGLPIPVFEVIRPETKLSEDIYGGLTIVKPSYAMASYGQGIELWRTPMVRYRAPEEFPADHPGRKGPMIAQRFIDCGKPMSCRVLTFFGEPIFTYCRQSVDPMNLPATGDVFAQGDYMPAPPNIAFSTRERDILELASEAYAAMPAIALHACDILREKDTGRLYLLETNPGGGTWMFSNRESANYRRRLEVDDLAAEFDAFRTIARHLVDRTRKEAC